MRRPELSAPRSQLIAWSLAGGKRAYFGMPTPLNLLQSDHSGAEITLALIGGRTGVPPYPAGSAVAIAPGLALTARHVLDGFWDEFGQRREDREASFSIQALQYLPGQDHPVLWHVTSAYDSDLIDIAILLLAPSENVPAGYSLPYPTLDVMPPEVGTQIQAFGYPQSEVTFEDGVGWILHHDAAGSTGKVTDIYPIFRDRGMLSFPCYEMDLTVVGGMSGGPVFDRAGHLRGVICSSLAPVNAPSWASTLWPSMALPAGDALEEGSRDDPLRLLHLARDGRILAHSLERLRLPSDNSDVRTWELS